jgi:CheY-like chemotaxis protein
MKAHKRAPNQYQKRNIVRTHMAEKILVIDDEEGVRTMLSLGLTRAGHKVVVAEDGPQGLKILAENPAGFTLLTTDFSMPGMNGIEVLQMIQTFGYPIARKFLISSARDSAEIAAIRAAGGRYITKPLVLDEFLAIIDSGK